MSAELDKLIAEGEIRGEIRGRVEERKELIKNLLAVGSLSKEVIAKCAKMPVEEVETLEKQFNKTVYTSTAMITDVDYVIYSTVSIFQVIDIFYDQLKRRWAQFIVEEFGHEKDQYLELFFAKDEAMNHRHEEHGFHLDCNGEGCFMVFGKKIAAANLDIFVREQIHSQNDIPTVSYNSKILAENLWEFTLVLPDTIEDNPFSRFIMDSLLNSIRGFMNSAEK